MRATLIGAVCAALLSLTSAWPAIASDQSPVFGKAKVQVLSKQDNAKVVGKGAYADYYGYYGNLYSYYANYFGSYARYTSPSNSTSEYTNYYYAYYYSYYATNNYYAAYYYSYYHL